ncbi:hypothetical protein EJ03DRAFT_113794 [Teratosphaeria nubilosa]|uniref:Uncharacterized protein n=1 Tax=Teratosphaeria nubilosa TaxID=161662 RepID=A0A6G1L7Y3_9PEZI|nr:hypothetical protein EJ03DRAFT_113794 [Teratosphaeria nubilosa]
MNHPMALGLFGSARRMGRYCDNSTLTVRDAEPTSGICHESFISIQYVSQNEKLVHLLLQQKSLGGGFRSDDRRRPASCSLYLRLRDELLPNAVASLILERSC